MAIPRYAELHDKYGHRLNLGHGGDILLPAFSKITDFRQHVKDIRHMELQSDDVLLCGFPKSGFHWVYEMISMLMAGKVEYQQGTGAEGFLDYAPQHTERSALGSEPCLFFTHLKFHHLPKQVWEKRVKVIYLRRNPKDTWVSLYNHTHGHAVQNVRYDGTWSQFFDLMISFGYWYGDWFDYALSYEREMQTQTDNPFLTCVFEETKRDTVSQVEKLDDFLGYSRGRQLCCQIADACSFGSMKEGKDNPIFTNLYRKGDVGDWKNWFTVAQNQQFNEVYSRRMADSKLSYTFELS